MWKLPSHAGEITRTADGVLRMTFELGKTEVGEGWRQLPSDDVHMFYPSPNIIMS
jgi:hypothetical protein